MRAPLFVATAALACGPTPQSPSPSAPPVVEAPSAQVDAATDKARPDGLDEALAAAEAGVDDEAIRALLRKHWEHRLERSPLMATSMGVHRWDDQLSDNRWASTLEDRKVRDGFLAEAKAIDATQLSTRDRVTLALFIEEIEGSQATDVCAFGTWSVSPRGNPVGNMNYLPEAFKLELKVDAENLVKRYRQIGPNIDAEIENLRIGLGEGRVANAESVRRTVAMARGELAKELAQWRLVTATEEFEGLDGMSKEDAAAMTAEVATVVQSEIQPAVQRYADFLEKDVLPKARDAEHSGLSSIFGGTACYEALIRQYTTLPKTAKEVHATGLKEMKRINKEMRALGKKTVGTGSLPKILKKLRTDPELHFTTSEEVQQFAVDALADAKKAMPKFFGVLPAADCDVVPIPDYEAPFTTIAYYRQPHADGSKPGEYFINTYAPQTRPRYEARVLAYHESIPGHHLQIAISQELDEVPAFRKYGGRTVFVEGWGLYTERLANEMGLYPEDLDRMGMLSFDAWRAGRLVVDTGIHAMGWSRQRAIDYLVKNTALAENNIDNEVDRYITTPGQALAYKTGQLEILALRKEAEKALGSAFTLPEFHDTLLTGGALSIPQLRERVRAWIATKKE